MQHRLWIAALPLPLLFRAAAQCSAATAAAAATCQHVTASSTCLQEGSHGVAGGATGVLAGEPKLPLHAEVRAGKQAESVSVSGHGRGQEKGQQRRLVNQTFHCTLQGEGGEGKRAG